MKAILILISIFLFIIIGYAAFKSAHDFSEGECINCHVDYKKNPKSLQSPITLLCKKCHTEITSASSHPYDVYPVSVKIPPDLLLHDGMITCNTCHNIHMERFSLSGEKTYFTRRTKIGKELCISCHIGGYDRLGNK